MNNINTKEHLLWWENNLGNMQHQFSTWLEQSDSDSRKAIFDFIRNNNINTVLECGPGTFIDYHVFFSKKLDISYAAIDITPKIVEQGKSLGLDIALSSIDNITKPNSSYELVYCRHVLEHQDYFSKALDEMLRVSSKYIAVAFWLLSDHNTIINYDSMNKLYHNSYSKQDIESHIEKLTLSYQWINCSNDKVLIVNKNHEH